MKKKAVFFVIFAVVVFSQFAYAQLKLTEQKGQLVLSNSKVTAEIKKSDGSISNYHNNDGVNMVQAIHIHPQWLTGDCDGYKVVANNDSLIDLAFIFRRKIKKKEGKPQLGLHVELHYAMEPDTPGVYTYFVWKVISGAKVNRYPDLKRTGVSKFRIVTKDTPYYYVDDQRQGVYPMHGMEKIRRVYDATWIFTDGTIHSKYDDLSLQYREHLLGKFNDNRGIFFVIPSNEWIGGGPFSQRVNQQYDGLMFMHLFDAHAGLPKSNPIIYDGWQHVFGPWLMYLNKAENKEQVLAKAKKQAQVEIAKWPYPWVKEPEYAAKKRVTVTGKLNITDGSSPEGAFVLLGDRGMHFQDRIQNYLYYRRADKDGNFTIPGVRPGDYKLYAFVNGVFGEYVQDGVEIKPGKDNDLGQIKWTPEKFGETLWQIGTPDRTGEEFFMGKHHHQWGMHILYQKWFPNDVDFYIGKSKEDKDWPYYHLTARQWPNIGHYNKGFYWDDKIKRMRFDFKKDQPADPDDKSQFDPYRPVPYRIHFDVEKDYQGKATLTIAVAGTMFHGQTLVFVNGKDITNAEPIRFLESATVRRCTGIGAYTLVRVPFDAKLLKRGKNTITLRAPQFKPTRKGKPPKRTIGNLVYDSLRLEAVPAK
jgi:rhamnogalacturonan endolyase